MASPSDAITHESSSPRADPKPVSISTMWPHAPDLPPGYSSLILEDRLLRALCNARFDNIYGPIGADMIQPSTHNNPSNQSVVNTTGHESLAPLPPTADQQASPSQSDDKRDRAIAKFREDHQRAISFDDEDDEQYYHNPLLVRQCSALASIFAPIRAPSPAFQFMNMFLVFNDGEQASDPNLSVSKQLNPAAPAFEYQPSHDNIQDTAPRPDQQAQPQDPISEPPSPEFPAEAARAPAPQPHTLRRGPVKLRELPHHPNLKKKAGKGGGL